MNAAEALAPEQSVDEVRESLSVTEKGQPANTIGNCRTVFCHDPLLRDAIRLNLLTDRVDIVRDLGWRRNTSALTDTDVKYLLLYFEQNYGLTSEKKMTAALSIVANENCYHPIQDVLNGLVWDGTPRIRSCLHHFLGAEVSDYVEEMLKHFLLGAIRRVFSPGSKYEEMLCLVGGQGAGKSSFFRLLAIRDEWFSDDLKKLDDDRVFLKQMCIRDRSMRYRIEYADGRYCNFANGRAELLKWLKLLKQEEISDIRKVYKSGVSDSVLETYRNYIRPA